MVTRRLLICLIALSLPSAIMAQGVQASASSNKNVYQVGDYIFYTIRVSTDTGTVIYTPALDDSLKSVTMLTARQPMEDDSSGLKTLTFTYVLSGYDSASVSIPRIPIMYKDRGDSVVRTALTNPVTFTVNKLNVNAQQDIKDVKPPVTVPLDWKEVLLWVAIILAAIAIGYVAYRLYRRSKTRGKNAAPVVILPPHVIALNALKDLAEQELWRRGQIKEYHSRITEIVRRYFEARFGMPAMELPTSEAVELLGKKNGSEPILKITYEFLSNADMVKFAKFTPLDSVNEQMMRQAVEIVNRTVVRAEPETQPESNDVR